MRRHVSPFVCLHSMLLGNLPALTHLLSAERQQPAGGVVPGNKPPRASCSALALSSGHENKARAQLNHELAPLRTSFTYEGRPMARLAMLRPLLHYIPFTFLPYASRELAGANTLAECGTSAARWRCCPRQETFSGQLQRTCIVERTRKQGKGAT